MKRPAAQKPGDIGESPDSATRGEPAEGAPPGAPAGSPTGSGERSGGAPRAARRGGGRTPRGAGRKREARRSGGRKILRLRPANPFDLIRVIAHSQSDARKAVAELVQNSFDAGAARVTLLRSRRRGEISLAILDDGAGVFPELDRESALERIATNVGHSFKKNLSPLERQEQMLLGKYGIGILGFWAVGGELEMRSRVAGSDVWCLRLVRDEPTAEVFRAPQGRIPLGTETWTEVVIRRVHAGVARQLSGRKLGDYLGSELRGQLLERKAKLRVVDLLARGTAPRDFLVEPRRYMGKRLESLFQVSVTGHGTARLELYIVDPDDERDRPPAVALTCGGTVVLDDVSGAEGGSLARGPWGAGQLEGLVEFRDLEVAPATRRGYVPGPATDALFEALRALEPELEALLEGQRANREAEAEVDIAREIRRVFRPVARALPQYDFFEVEAGVRGSRRGPGEARSADEGATPDAASSAVPGARAGDEAAEGVLLPDEPPAGPSSEVVDAGDVREEPPGILPPGPLEAVRIVPRRARLLPGASRQLQARCCDAMGQRILEGVDYAWSLKEGEGRLQASGDRAIYFAPERSGSTARIFVEARQWKRTCETDALIEVVDRLAGEGAKAGIPDPKRVYDPAGDWRSRVLGKRWEYNAAHPDYQVVAAEPRRRLRYLAQLFAKEIVLRNYGAPADERILERLVEVLAHIELR